MAGTIPPRSNSGPEESTPPDHAMPVRGPTGTVPPPEVLPVSQSAPVSDESAPQSKRADSRRTYVVPPTVPIQDPTPVSPEFGDDGPVFTNSTAVAAGRQTGQYPAVFQDPPTLQTTIHSVVPLTSMHAGPHLAAVAPSPLAATPTLHCAEFEPSSVAQPAQPLANTPHVTVQNLPPISPTLDNAEPHAGAFRSTGMASDSLVASSALSLQGEVPSWRSGAFAMAMPGWTPPTNDAVTIRSQRGDYVVGGQVGAGNFGAVYECMGPFDQRYALKVLRPSGRPTDRVREEWASEVRRLMQLRHPNVVYIHDAFEWERAFCVALEWCDHTLHEMLEQPLQEELAIELSRQMLAAVQYLHDWDLVHDDLHPGNVLIQQADRPIVKISDFGISAELRGAPTVRPEIVHHAIMAPELIAVGYTSKQSDLYQLGMIMYWMITGHPPMELHIPYEHLVQQISEGVARQRAEQLGTPLGNIVAKMLRRRDAYRYTSAREVWNDLRQLPVWQARHIFRVR